MGESFADWLAEIGLESYASKFQENDIDFAVVRDLSEADLKELGLTLGHRKKFQHALARLDANRALAAVALAPSVPQEESISGERRQLTVMFCDLVVRRPYRSVSIRRIYARCCMSTACAAAR
jgi:hypothetical protein